MKALTQKFSCTSIKQLVLFLVTCFCLASCSQEQTDKEIKADITVKAKSNLNFANVNFTVDKGVVTLTGKCPSEQNKEHIEATIKSISIVKGIIDSIQIAPVTITADQPLKQAVDSVLMDYANVDANVSNDTVTLMGKAKKQELTKLMQQMKKLNPLQINNEIKEE